MKRAQTVVEYVFLSVLTILLAVIAIGAFHLADIGAGAAFGVKIKNNIMAIPPMTP